MTILTMSHSSSLCICFRACHLVTECWHKKKGKRKGVAYLAEMGRDSTSSPTLSTSTTRLSSYFLMVLEINFTVIFCSLWGCRVPVLGTISNSRGGPLPGGGAGDALSVELSSRSSVQQMLGLVPSPGTRRWNFIGTREVFWSLHVWVFRNPATHKRQKYNTQSLPKGHKIHN